jgi:hypothetical protein
MAVPAITLGNHLATLGFNFQNLDSELILVRIAVKTPR